MTVPSEFGMYRARLLRARDPILGATLPRVLWGKIVRVRGEMTYTRERMVARYGDDWPKTLADAASDDQLDILGSDDGRAWTLLSTWRPAPRSDSPTKPQPGRNHREDVRDAIRSVLAKLDKEPSRGVAAWHMHRQGLTREEIEKTMREFGWFVKADRVRDHLRYGRGREDAGEQCPFDLAP